MRRFVGYRPNPPAEYLEAGTAAPPDEPQYEGVVFADGSVACRWRTEFRSNVGVVLLGRLLPGARAPGVRDADRVARR